MFTETLHLNFQDLKYRFRNKNFAFFFFMAEESFQEKGHVKAFNSSRENIVKTLRAFVIIHFILAVDFAAN